MAVPFTHVRTGWHLLHEFPRNRLPSRNLIEIKKIRPIGAIKRKWILLSTAQARSLI
jgi:hypothetical protein